MYINIFIKLIISHSVLMYADAYVNCISIIDSLFLKNNA